MAGKVGVLGHIFQVGGLTAVSRVLGLLREMMQSRLIGAGVEQSAFTLAFAIPNMARKLFGEGALTAAFVPIFKGEVAQGNIEAARRLANAVITMVMMILVSVVVLAFAGVTSYAWFADMSPRTALTLRLVRVLLPYMIFICGAAFGMGVLNALSRFREGAFMPVMLNAFWIAALGGLCFFPQLALSTRITVVCWAILFGGIAQMAYLFRCMAKQGYSLRPSFAWFRDSNVRLVWRNTIVGACGAGAIQINYMLDQVLAQYAAPWAAGVIGYAERLMDLPLGVVGVAFGTVLLPTFSGFFANKDLAGATKTLGNSILNLLAVMIPAGAGLCVLAAETTSVVYEGNAFDALATLRVSRSLAVYSLGLAFFGFQKAFIPWFHAQRDMKTPLNVSVASVCINAILNILAVRFLPEEWRHVGLAGSTVFCALFGCVLLACLAHRKNGRLGLVSLLLPVAKLLLASAVMAVVLVLIRPFLAGMNRYLALCVMVFDGIGIYVLMLVCLRMRFNLRFAK